MKLFLTLILLGFFIAPAYAEDRPTPVLRGLKQLEDDPCSANDLKQFMQGSFVITGYKKSDKAVPAAEDVYVGTATAKLYECQLMVKRCVGGTTETGEMKKTVALADAIPVWEFETKTQGGETRKYIFQMASNTDNYPVLFGGGEDAFEFWRPDPDENATCP
ncbi:MAG: hypothetical protein WBK55_07310 [Alphaproteobacteria bacterium]